MLGFFLLVSLFSLPPSFDWPSEQVFHDALSEAVFVAYYDGDPEKHKKTPGLSSFLASALGWESLNFTLEPDPEWNCEENQGGWDADTWEYAFDPAAVCPLPPRIDPTGEIFVAKRGRSIYGVRNGKATRLGPVPFGDSNSITRVVAADLDFDGEPELFLMVSFGSAGEFYLLVDANGTDAPVKRLFAPYLEEVDWGDFLPNKPNMIFDGLQFDRENKAILLSSGGINSFMTREFRFADGKYHLVSAGSAVEGKDGSMIFEVDYAVDAEGKAIRRSATTPGSSTAPPMLLVRSTDYFAQSNAEQWNKPQRIDMRHGQIRIYPEGKDAVEDLLAVPFSLGGELGTVPPNTWVQLEDVAWLEGPPEEERADPQQEEGEATDLQQEEAEAAPVPGMWCKVSFPLPAPKKGASAGEHPAQGAEHAGWIPCSGILYALSGVGAREYASSAARIWCEVEQFYISGEETNSEGAWFRIEQTQSAAWGWVPRSEVEKRLP